MMHRSRLLTDLVGFITLLAAPVAVTTAAPRMSPFHAPDESSQRQGSSPAWIVWETETPVQRQALKGDVLWVGHDEGGLSRWDLTRGFERSFGSSDGLPGEDVLDITVDSNGDVWVALLDGSVARSGDGSSFANLSPRAPADENAWALDVSGGDVLLGTLGGGVAQRSGGSWTVDTSDGTALPFDDIYTTALEADINAWVGTLGHGIAAKRAGLWTVFELPLSIPDPLNPGSDVANRVIMDIAIEGSGTKWFATDGSGVAVLDAGNSSWTVYDRGNSGLSSESVQAIFMDSSGNRWFGDTRPFDLPVRSC